MSAARHSIFRGGLFLAVLAIAALPAVQGQQEEKAKLTDRQQKIVQAARKGVMYLKSTQNAQGTWGPGVHPVGYASLPALALLEVGMPADDVTVQKAAAFVRLNAPRLDETYELALAILFLHRLGNKNDEPIIRSLAMRLIAGQTFNGGWSYRCPVLTPQEEVVLFNFLQKNQPKFDPNQEMVTHPYLLTLPKSLESLIDPTIRKEREASLFDPNAKIPMTPDPLDNPLPLLIPKDSKADPTPNYQPKPDPVPKNDPAPSDPPVKKEQPKLIRTPISDKETKKDDSPGDKGDKTPASDTKPDAKPDAKTPPEKEKTADDPKQKKPMPDLAKSKYPAARIDQWPSVPQFVTQSMRPNIPQPFMMKDDNSNTQFAILGLWAARNYGVPTTLTLVRLDKRFRSSQFQDGSWSYIPTIPGGFAPPGKHTSPSASMTCVGLLGLGIGHGAFQEAVLADKKNPSPANFVYDQAVQKGLLSLGKQIGPKGNWQLGGGINFYYLWSVERVAVMYQLPTIGAVDWYSWGVNMILPRQSEQGFWAEQGYPGSTETSDTSMALLFLARANLNRDLSSSLRRYMVVVDPSRPAPAAP